MGYGDGSPELSDGYTRIANEVLDALAKVSLSDYESRCVHFLWRKTYGWNDAKGLAKKSDIISLSQWEEGTQADRRGLRRALESLVTRKIFAKSIIKAPGKNPVTVWSFQKYYKDWQSLTLSKVGDSQPPLTDQVGDNQPPLTDQVGDNQPLDSLQVGDVHPIDKTEPETGKVGDVHPIEVGDVHPIEVGDVHPPTIDNIKIIKDIEKKKKNNNKKKKNSPQISLKEKVDLIAQELKPQYPAINFDHELLKFKAYWFEGQKQLKIPKLALINWMDKAGTVKVAPANGGNHAESQGSHQGSLSQPGDTTQKLKAVMAKYQI